MNILIVGAGAVGQVYGYHFQQAGHRISYLIKEKYREKIVQGMTLLPLTGPKLLTSRRPPSPAIHFFADDIVTQWPAESGFDLIILTIPSDALRALPYDDVRQTCINTPLLMLQPSREDHQQLQQELPGTPIAEGLISLIAYQAPLPGLLQTTDTEKENSGIAYYLPPLKMSISSASPALARQITALFNQGGIRARVSASAIEDSAIPSAFLMTFLCVLQASDWRFQQLRRNSKQLKTLSRAQRFLIPMQKPAGFGRTLLRIGGLILLRPWLYRLLLTLSPKVLPLPLEAYLAFHFQKVHQQTRLYMEDYYRQHPDLSIRAVLNLCQPIQDTPE
ncbi:ketopantoate reductase family protein [Bacterioplanoides sp.]|uniref:ketopantoate reductase family protein n=1 Tax=Bacterioplanoides sp. TaxID=2066072 RepID=UPI003B00CDF2